MTDHKAKAIDMALMGGDLGQVSSAQMEGLIHSVVYLAEQQRIANLIALLPELNDAGDFDRMDRDRHIPSEREVVYVAIHEGLGLA